MNVGEAIEIACKEPTLEDALTWICVWESERIVKQGLSKLTRHTCFKICIESVIEKYNNRS